MKLNFFAFFMAPLLMVMVLARDAYIKIFVLGSFYWKCFFRIMVWIDCWDFTLFKHKFTSNIKELRVEIIRNINFNNELFNGLCNLITGYEMIILQNSLRNSKHTRFRIAPDQCCHVSLPQNLQGADF